MPRELCGNLDDYSLLRPFENVKFFSNAENRVSMMSMMSMENSSWVSGMTRLPLRDKV
jgi:hypothetical protein